MAGVRCAKLWYGKADHPREWLFRSTKSAFVTAARVVADVCRWYWGPSFVALAVKP
jgi:hypothetical protein